MGNESQSVLKDTVKKEDKGVTSELMATKKIGLKDRDEIQVFEKELHKLESQCDYVKQKLEDLKNNKTDSQEKTQEKYPQEFMIDKDSDILTITNQDENLAMINNDFSTKNIKLI